jgi:hypothetical protein
MTGISDYASLMIDAAEYAGRANIAHIFPRLLGLAETKLNRVLRVADMMTIGTVTLTDGDGTLPADFLEAYELLSPRGLPLRAVSAQQLTNSYRNLAGTPAGYAIVGSSLNVRPTAGGDVTLTYYAKIPPLTPAAPTNWLLEKAPDVYLYALVAEIAIASRDAAGAQSAMQLMGLAIQGLQIEDERRRWGNAQVVVGGVTP